MTSNSGLTLTRTRDEEADDDSSLDEEGLHSGGLSSGRTAARRPQLCHVAHVRVGTLEAFGDQCVNLVVGSDMASKYELEKAMPLGEKAVQSAADAVVILKRLEPAANDALAVAKSAPDLIGRERLAALEYVTKEREATIKVLRETVAEERKVLADDAEKIGAQVVDQAVFRVAQLTSAVLATVFVGVVVLLWIARRVFVGRRAVR